ncbi:hypothetical protein MRB53_037610 [Persea americana]|nr:hypothetical protein MRB53_037610 [Persea americana]
MKLGCSLSLLPLLTAASPLIRTGTIHHDVAPILSSSTGKDIPDQYIVLFKDHVSHDTALLHHSWVQDVHVSHSNELRKRSQFPIMKDYFSGLKHTYHIPGGLLGYSGHFDEDVIEQIRRHPDVSQEIAHS